MNIGKETEKSLAEKWCGMYHKNTQCCNASQSKRSNNNKTETTAPILSVNENTYFGIYHSTLANCYRVYIETFYFL